MKFRKAQPDDIVATYSIRASTRQNPISKDQLISAGFSPESVSERFSKGKYVGWVCEEDGIFVGFATGDTVTGEIVVVAVLAGYEGKQIGKTLLSHLIDSLLEKGCTRLWLEASPDPKIRAHGFYRANGWIPTGRKASNGDEILELKRYGAPAG